MNKKRYNLLLVTCLTGLLIGTLTAQASSALDCNNYSGCEKKFCEIEKQLTIAQNKKVRHKVAGLNKALKEAKSNCTDEALKKDLAEKIDEIQGNISEYEIELKEATGNNKSDKVIKYKQNILEEELKLKQLRAEFLTIK